MIRVNVGNKVFCSLDIPRMVIGKLNSPPVPFEDGSKVGFQKLKEGGFCFDWGPYVEDNAKSKEHVKRIEGQYMVR